MNIREPIIQTLQTSIPGLMAIYAFGSRVQGILGPESDLDLAVLVVGYADVLNLFDLSGDLADIAYCAVDLLDLRARFDSHAIPDHYHWPALVGGRLSGCTV